MYVIVDNLRTPKNTFIVTSKWATILILIVPKKIPILLHFDNIKCYLQSYHKLECFFFVFFPSFSFSLLTREYIYFYPTLSQLWNIHTFTLAKAAYNKHKNNMLSAPCPENSWFLSHSILSVWCRLFFFSLSRVFACMWLTQQDVQWHKHWMYSRVWKMKMELHTQKFKTTVTFMREYFKNILGHIVLSTARWW